MYSHSGLTSEFDDNDIRWWCLIQTNLPTIDFGNDEEIQEILNYLALVIWDLIYTTHKSLNA